MLKPQTSRRSPLVVALLAVLLGAMVTLFAWQTEPAYADDDTQIWKGKIEAMPGEGPGVGEWTVGGETFVADSATEFDEEEGPLVVGACAKVEYTEDNGVKRAEEIDSEPASDCDGSGGGDDGGDDDLEWRGLVEATPGNEQRQGEWTVRGRVFVADSSTEFDEEEGSIQLDACVKVEYTVQANGSYRAREIDSEPANDCTGDDDGGGDGGNGDDDQKRYARIDIMPASGLIGTWTLGGEQYMTDSNTYFEQEHGGFSVNACVEVEYITGTPPMVKELKTESSYKCNGQSSDDDDDNDGDDDNSDNFPEGELYGVIRSLPENGLIGPWTIGSVTMTVTERTRLEADDTPFAVGVLVEAEFYTNADDENIAIEIESKYRTDDDGSDDDDSDDDRFPGNEGHAFGIIEVMPSGNIGTWTISGIAYLVDERTRLDQGDDDDTPLAVGVNVKVEYYGNDQGDRVAIEIETSDDDGAPSQSGHFKTYGFIDQKPNGSFNGIWIIDGVSFVADQNTLFDDSLAMLSVDAYVEVEYQVVDGVNHLKKIETHVPPGAGDDDNVGRVQAINPSVARQTQASNSVWVVDGVTYTVTDATAQNKRNGSLSIGSTVFVNSYTDSAGNRIATQIRSVTLNNMLFLPAVTR